MKIEELGLSIRAYNCLKRKGIDTVEKLAGMPDDDLMSIRCFGVGCLEEVHRKLGKEESIRPVTPGPAADDPNITELCFNNGKERGRKEFKMELIAKLMEMQVGAHRPEHAVLVRVIKMVEEL